MRQSVKLLDGKVRQNGIGKLCHKCEMKIEKFPYVRRYMPRRSGSKTVYYHPECAEMVNLVF